MKTKESARQILQECLLTFGPAGGTKEDLLLRSGLGSASFYREIPQLVAENIAELVGNRYRLPMRRLHNYRFKLWRDADKLRQRPDWVQSLVEQVLQQAQEELGNDLLALWLTGSAAHGTQTESSDIDFLAITRKSTDFFPRVPHKVQFLTLLPGEFQRSLSRADNFCLATLRYGLLLEDRGWARPFLDMALEPQPRLVQLREALEDQWHRAISARKSRAKEDEFQATAAYANTLGRALLAAFEELPAGKPELLRLLNFYYGESILDRFRPLLEGSSKPDPFEFENHLSRLEELADNFFLLAPRFQELQKIYFSHGPQFNLYCYELVLALTRGKIEPTSRPTDVWLNTGGASILLACKSIAGTDFTDSLMRFGFCIEEQEHESQVLQALFVGNPQNKTSPLLRDWKIADQSTNPKLKITSCQELMVAYAELVLLGTSCSLQSDPTGLIVDLL